MTLIHFPNHTIGLLAGMTAETKKTRLVRELACFVQRYGRKAQKRGDPNDRQYDKKLEKTMRRLPPTDLSDLLSDDGEEK
ncbi:hypothetical protein PPGU19_008050 [Paraburkholderia sp. PGU19]|uniref:hypothetical protein n=1 Tax=Paraburkholderia sp. PGU19 TaxID=2735434 RepID=UPI0015DD134C|nr:hypothetical protein [Paraburkholderia sp. PGU19]BCF96236.1 hypothetical protein PPGU19_008050 [Paraburkholderia sp. PGU19]